ncbi:VOC family protein, partial [Alphaproteobacteria bacterium]|nr:VOC family protein [Alphaproteobacteria bacterium]
LRRIDNSHGKFSLIFLSAPGDSIAQIELTYNWENESYDTGRNFGHIAYKVENIYTICQKLKNKGVIINRPPRDGKMAFIRSPDNISIELLQDGEPLEPEEPWISMPNIGKW